MLYLFIGDPHVVAMSCSTPDLGPVFNFVPQPMHRYALCFFDPHSYGPLWGVGYGETVGRCLAPLIAVSHPFTMVLNNEWARVKAMSGSLRRPNS